MIVKKHYVDLTQVLNKVFETLDVQDLATCRLVSKIWLHNASLKANLRKKAIISLRCIFLHTSTTRENLVDYFRFTGPIYQNYHFSRISYQNDLISTFFQVVGQNIRILKLQLDLNQLNIHQFRELIFERVPNLTELNIYSLSHEEIFLKPLFQGTGPLPPLDPPKHERLQRLEIQEVRTPITSFMAVFLKSLPNIKDIALKVDVCSDWAEQADLWRENSPIVTSVVKGLERSEAYKTLNVFRGGKVRVKCLEYLLEMGHKGLQLEILDVHMPQKEAEDTFNSFIKCQRHTLKQLIIFEQRGSRYSNRQRNNEESEVFVLKLPELMPKLELLQLSKFPKSVMVPMKPVDYTRQCPGLKKLIFLGYPDGYARGSLYVPTQPCTSLEEITLWNRVHVPDIAYILGQSFTNLSKLVVRFPNQDFLKGLWKNCFKIRNLTLYLEEGIFMDEGITGLPTSLVSRWVESSDNKSLCNNEREELLDWVGYNSNQLENSIRNLKGPQFIE